MACLVFSRLNKNLMLYLIAQITEVSVTIAKKLGIDVEPALLMYQLEDI
jgi:hypothetical protein